MISHDTGCIFVHQRKAAGTSFERIFPDILPGSPQDGQFHNHLVRQHHSQIPFPDGSLAVDRIIFFENMNEGIEMLSQRLGTPLGSLPRKNRNEGRRDCRAYIDDEARTLFDETCREDIEPFGHDFYSGLPNPRRRSGVDIPPATDRARSGRSQPAIPRADGNVSQEKDIR